MSLYKLRELMKPFGSDLTHEQLTALRSRLYRIADGITDVIMSAPTDSTIVDEHGVSPGESQLLEMGIAVEYTADDGEAEQ